MRASVSTINGKKPIGSYDPVTKIYSKWIQNKHRLWKAGGAICIDKAYIDDIWPDCEVVKVVNKTSMVEYTTTTDMLRRLSWTDDAGRLHQERWGEQYALDVKYWIERRLS